MRSGNAADFPNVSNDVNSLKNGDHNSVDAFQSGRVASHGVDYNSDFIRCVDCKTAALTGKRKERSTSPS